MIKHIVMWKLKEENKVENAAKIQKMLEGLQGRIDGLLYAEVRRGFGEKSYDLCLYSEFTSPQALAHYQEHPLHQEVRNFVHQVITERAACDYEP